MSQKVMAKRGVSPQTMRAMGAFQREPSRDSPALAELVKANNRILKLEDTMIRLRKDSDGKDIKNTALQQEVEKLKLEIASLNAALKEDEMAQKEKKIEQLSYQVRYSSVRANDRESLAEQLKKDRGEFLKERRNFTNRYEALNRKVQRYVRENKKLVVRIMAVKNALQCKHNELEEVNEEHALEKVAWEKEIQRMKNYMDNDNAIKKMIYDKNLSRQLGDDPKMGNLSQGLKQLIVMARWATENGPGGGDDSAPGKETTLERALNRIQDIMGAPDLDSALEMFVAVEDPSHDMMARLHAAQQEIKRLHEQMDQMQRDAETNSRTFDAGAHKKLAKAESKMKQAEFEYMETAQSFFDYRKIFKEVKQYVIMIAKRCNAVDDTMPFVKEAADDVHVFHPFYVIKYLGCIDEKVTSLVARLGRQPQQRHDHSVSQNAIKALEENTAALLMRRLKNETDNDSDSSQSSRASSASDQFTFQQEVVMTRQELKKAAKTETKKIQDMLRDPLRAEPIVHDPVARNSVMRPKQGRVVKHKRRKDKDDPAASSMNLTSPSIPLGGLSPLKTDRGSGRRKSISQSTRKMSISAAHVSPLDSPQNRLNQNKPLASISSIKGGDRTPDGSAEAARPGSPVSVRKSDSGTRVAFVDPPG